MSKPSGVQFAINLYKSNDQYRDGSLRRAADLFEATESEGVIFDVGSWGTPCYFEVPNKALEIFRELLKDSELVCVSEWPTFKAF